MIWLFQLVSVHAAFINSISKSSTCATGTYRQPDDYYCFDYCPTGYTADSTSNTCVGSQKEVLHYTFNTLKDTVPDSASSFDLNVAGTTAPYSVKDGGKYFNGSKYLQIPSGVRFGTAFSIELWVSMALTSSNIMAFYSKKVRPTQNSNYQDDLTFALSKSYVYFAAESFSLYWLYSDSITFKKWNKVQISVDSFPPNTDVKFYVNDYSDVLTMQNRYFYEDATTVTWLGRRQRTSGSYNKWFNGMIYEFSASNFAKAFGQTTNASLTVCEYYQFNTSGVCSNCVSCTTCVRKSDCNLCADSMCAQCNDYAEGSCTNCLSPAVFASGVCNCPSGQYKYAGKCLSKD